jgi:GT2 family glycosyltransferase
MSLDDEYQRWLRKNAIIPEKLGEIDSCIDELRILPKMSIIMPVYNTHERWLRRAIESVVGQIYPLWELCAVDDASTEPQATTVLTEYASKDDRIKIKFLRQNEGIAGTSNRALQMATGDFVGLLDHDDELTPDACLEVVKALNGKPDTDFFYSDEDKIDEMGIRHEVFFKPDWSPDLHLSVNYVTHFSVYRRRLLLEIGGFRYGFEGSQDYDLSLRVTEKTSKIHHIAEPLYSWRKVKGSAAGDARAKPHAIDSAKRALSEAISRRALDATVLEGRYPTTYRVKYSLKQRPLVSVIIPFRDSVNFLEKCIESLTRLTTYTPYELILVNNRSCLSETKSFIESLSGIQILDFDEDFNFSRIINFGVSRSKGDYLLFLNSDTEIISPDWVECMLEHAQRHEVGIVGPKLLLPDNRIQAAGDLLGFGGIAYHQFFGLNDSEQGYFTLPHLIRNCSAVTAACMLVRKQVFQELNGFDEMLGVEFGDVDFCLRTLQRGYRIIYTPYSLLLHYEGTTRGRNHVCMPDREEFLRRWSPQLKRGDPFYSPHLDMHRMYRIRLEPMRSSAEGLEGKDSEAQRWGQLQINRMGAQC